MVSAPLVLLVFGKDLLLIMGKLDATCCIGDSKVINLTLCLIWGHYLARDIN